jgi:hypothetical protein
MMTRGPGAGIVSPAMHDVSGLARLEYDVDDVLTRHVGAAMSADPFDPMAPPQR